MNWLMRILIALVVLAAVAVAAFQLLRPQIAERAFARGVDRNVGVDRSADLPDGLHVYLCGTGSPMPDIARAGPCVGVLAGRDGFIFDAGSGSVRKLSRMGFPTDRLQGAYLTHLHSDHIDGLGELMLQAWIAGQRDQPLPVSGPRGTRKVVEAFNTAYEIDRGYRIAHHGTEVANPSGFGAEPSEIILPAGPGGREVVYSANGVTITAIRVEHAPVEPAFGYRIDYKDRSVSLSGDTIYHPGFVAASQGVDLMLHEALDPEMVTRMAAAFAARGNDAGATIFHDILDYHATPEDGARAAAEAGAGELIYYHIVPPLPAPLLNRMWLGDSKSHFDGPMRVGEDGMLVSLPAGSDDVLHGRAY